MIVVHGVPFYWGVETEPIDRSALTRSTLHEVLPPYRLSLWAFRIRVTPWHWLHVGRFRYDDAVGRYGLTDDLDEIRQWRGPRAKPAGEPVGDPEAGEAGVAPASHNGSAGPVG